jgi:hypothetical protein
MRAAVAAEVHAAAPRLAPRRRHPRPTSTTAAGSGGLGRDDNSHNTSSRSLNPWNAPRPVHSRSVGRAAPLAPAPLHDPRRRPQPSSSSSASSSANHHQQQRRTVVTAANASIDEGGNTNTTQSDSGDSYGGVDNASSADSASASAATPGQNSLAALTNPDELDALISLLPPRLRETLQQHPRRLELLEVVLDLGRRPLARFADGDQVLSENVLDYDDIAHALESVGDGRGTSLTHTRPRLRGTSLAYTRPHLSCFYKASLLPVTNANAREHGCPKP